MLMRTTKAKGSLRIRPVLSDPALFAGHKSTGAAEDRCFHSLLVKCTKPPFHNFEGTLGLITVRL